MSGPMLRPGGFNLMWLKPGYEKAVIQYRIISVCGYKVKSKLRSAAGDIKHNCTAAGRNR
jgi:hypothetical protein